MSDSNSKALRPGTVLRGRVYTYIIEKVLGQGSFGITYLASTSIPGPLGRVTVAVALKEFFAKELDSRQADGTVTARTEEGVAHKYARAFQRESENLSRMEHPGIVNVLEAFEAKGTYYYAMEYLSGGSLDDKVKGSGIPESEALPLIRKIGEALSFMHERKVMHLDLKPKNIMLKGDGTPVIIDFGLSKQYDDSGEPESSSSIGLGTPGYAPIEQATQTSGRSFQPTLDIYALGATLYKMLTGVTPPAATLILNKKTSLVPALMEKGVSETVVSAISKAMSPLMDDRPQSVGQFLSLLDGEEENTIKRPRPEPTPKPGPEPKPSPEPAPVPGGKKPKTWLWALLAGVVVAGIIVAVILGGKGKRPGPEVPVVPSDSVVVVTETPSVGAASSTSSSASPSEPTAPGSVKISSTPSGAAIWLDGKSTKKTTPEILEDLTPGKHKVKLVLEGYNDYNGTTTITSGKRADLSQTLVVKEAPAVASPSQTPAQTQPTVSAKQEEPATPPAEKPTTGKENGHDWVDLGLSVKWATCNVGASSPSDYGNYYAWGETSPKSEYSWSNLKYCSDDSGDSFTKYNTKSNYGSVDNKTRLDLSDDAARANWGGKWRMPTKAEFDELKSNCTYTWTTQGGKNGYKVTSKKNGNRIFLPAAGYRYGTSVLNAGSYGIYWSSSLFTGSPFSAWLLLFNSSDFYTYGSSRRSGFSVRPVTE